MLLAIETSTSRSSVALAAADGVVLAAAELGLDRRHGEFVSPAIAHLLHHVGASIDDLTSVAAGTGPGLYTGLRVGLVTAATIASTHDLPCVGVLGPDAIAHGLRHATGDVVVALDARRRELYVARYRAATVGGVDVVEPVDDLVVSTPDDAAAALVAARGDRDEPLLLAGDGVLALLDALRAAGEDATLARARLAGPRYDHPTAAAIVPLALAALADGAAGGPEVLRPLYLRDADARIGWDQRGRLRGGTAAG